ncbi:MAG: DUF4430 domain-containing protein [Methanosarcinales archaeon]|nr:DUF4430 domain-containing protein [Methanosarcinales archaeon]
MNTRIIGALLAAMICITMVAPAMAQPSPFVITGHVSDSDGNPCNDAWVQVTNTNTSTSWNAENVSTSNYYRLVLDSDDVSTGNVLQIEASGCTETKMVEHAVTQSELEDGGMIGFDIVFDAPQETIWQGDVILINGTTFDVTANSSVSYVINRTTALGALDAAAEDGIFNYTVNDDWYASWGSLFVDSIADIASEGYNGWMYWVNYPEDPMPGVGADQFVLEDGDVVTWYWSSSMDMTPANSSKLVNITVAIEEPQETIWQGDVILINGTTFDVTANSSVSYVINRTTALGALDAAAEDGIFNYTVNDDWYASWGSLFVDSIADIASEGYNGWMYWVNYPEDPMPGVGADQFVLEDGDVVTWYWSSSMDMTPANSSILVEINVTVTSPDLIAVTIHSPPAITNDSTPLLHATFDQIAVLTWYVIDNEDAVTGGSNTDNLTVMLPELLDGQHTVTVYANNSDGNVGSATQDFLVDTTAPVINSVTLDPADPNTGDDITVTVNVTDNVGVTAVTADGEPLSNADGDDTWEGTITASEGTHNVNISASDAAGNTVYDETASYTATTPVPTLPVVLIEDITAAPNSYAFTSVMVKNVTGLGSGSITVTYNTSVVHVTNVTSGDGNALAVQDWNVDNSAGSVQILAQDINTSYNGDVVLAIVTFHAVGEYPDSTPLAISSSELIDYTSYDIIGHSVTNGTFSIIDNEPPVITDAIATPDVILNDNGRPRIPGTDVTVLNATVLDSGSGVVNVTIDLSPIGGSDDQVMERIAGTDVWTVATTATDGINLTHELVVTATDGEDNTNTSVIGLTVLLRGDVVRDGDLNSADVLYMAKYLVGKEPMPSLLVSDMHPAEGDGKITSADALYLAKYLVGKEAAP